MAEDHLSEQSLGWGFKHVARLGLSDFVPRAFELDALQADAGSLIGSTLGNVDLTTKDLRPFRKLLVPRPTGGYRLSTELDPLDGVVFAAISHEIAPLVEANSTRRESTGSIAGRVQITDEGELFSGESWQDFAARSLQFSKSNPQYRYVVFADIADFYGQIDLSLLEKRLLRAGIPEIRTGSIIQLLRKCNSQSSRGIPQGPTLSRLLAEIMLSGVDKFLFSEFVPFIRYADDFRIFAETMGQAERLLFRLARVLLEEYGFTLAGPKTQVVAATRSRGFPRTVAEASVSGPDSQGGPREGVLVSFETENPAGDAAALDAEPLPIQRARTALSNGRALHPAALTESVYRNLPRLTSIMRDVVDYLATDVDSEITDAQKDAVRSFATSANMEVPFIRWVMTSLLLTRRFLTSEEVFRISQGAKEDLGLRPALEAAHRLKKTDWLAAQIDEYPSFDLWDRRAMLFWGQDLEVKAREKLLVQAEKHKDVLDGVVIRWSQTEAATEYKSMASSY